MALLGLTKFSFWLDSHDFLDDAISQLRKNRDRPEEAQHIAEKILKVLPPSKIYAGDAYRLSILFEELLFVSRNNLALTAKVIDAGFATSAVMQKYTDFDDWADAINEDLIKAADNPILKRPMLIHAIPFFRDMARRRSRGHRVDEFRKTMFKLCGADAELAASTARETLDIFRPLAVNHASKLCASLEDSLQAAGENKDLRAGIIRSAAAAVPFIPAFDYSYGGDLIHDLWIASGDDNYLKEKVADAGIALMDMVAAEYGYGLNNLSYENCARNIYAICRDVPVLQRRVRDAIINKIATGSEADDKTFSSLSRILPLARDIFDGLAFRTAAGADIFISWPNDRSFIKFAVRENPMRILSYIAEGFKGTAAEIAHHMEVESTVPEKKAAVEKFIASAQQTLGYEPAASLPNLADAVNQRIAETRLRLVA